MTFMFNPVFLIRNRMSLQGAESASMRKYKGFFDALSIIVKEEGIVGLYKGLVPALILTSHATIQVCYDTLNYFHLTHYFLIYSLLFMIFLKQ